MDFIKLCFYILLPSQKERIGSMKKSDFSFSKYFHVLEDPSQVSFTCISFTITRSFTCISLYSPSQDFTILGNVCLWVCVQVSQIFWVLYLKNQCTELNLCFLNMVFLSLYVDIKYNFPLLIKLLIYFSKVTFKNYNFSYIILCK